MNARSPPTADSGDGGERTAGGVADAVLLVAAKLALGLWVLDQGFTHVSDDDYARTAIAERFARSPGWDPSGTSWLPLPFWLEGTAMLLFGCSLRVARVVAVVFGAVSVAAPYAAMRAARVSRAAAVVATAIGMAIPWNAWLAVATVPEAWAGALTGAAALATGRRRAQPMVAGGLFAASLCRYEAWPACAVVAGLCSLQAVGAARRRHPVWRDVGCAGVAVAGPLSWMAWNAHAHGNALHFLARVSAFRRAIGAADATWSDKLLGYPRALFGGTPEVAFLGVVATLGLLASASLRNRWRWAAAIAVATVAFLVAGDLGDGAPTHHAARALAGIWWILVAVGVDALFAFGRWPATLKARGAFAFAALATAAAWCALLPARWRDSPGRDASERRDEQIARGLDMRARGVPRAEITPCAFEHFALIAAWGEPQRAVIRPRTGTPVTEACPKVDEL